MEDRTKILKGMVDLTKKIRSDYSYIRVTEYPNFYFISTDDKTDPMIFDKRGFFTGRNFVEIKSKDLRDPKQIFYEGG